MHGKLDLRQLVNFYDYAIESSATHAAAVNAMMGEELGVSLMLHYFQMQGKPTEALAVPCTQGTQKGKRLDKWFVQDDGENVFLYQTEIKNWSAHSLGGTRATEKLRGLPINSKEWSEHRKKVWDQRFTIESTLKDPKTWKVLTPMKPPPKYEKAAIKPVICFWEGMHPEGKTDVFFDVPLKDEKFDKLFVFSMSNFVHQLLARGIDFLDVAMPNAVIRKDWIEKLFCDTPPAECLPNGRIPKYVDVCQISDETAPILR
jgi:hypothetical protein